MSELIRVKIDGGPAMQKARMFARGSHRRECICCKEKRYGVLFRHVAPVKYESLICHECVLDVSLGQSIVVLPERIAEYENAVATATNEIIELKEKLKSVRIKLTKASTKLSKANSV